MKILHVLSSMDPISGGACQAIRNTVPALEKLGVQNEVAALDHPEADFLNKDSFKIHALGPGKGPWNYGSKLKPWLSENVHRFDVVIIHGLWLYYSHATATAVRRLKKISGGSGKTGYPKLYCMPHGMLDPYFQRAPDRKLKAIRNWIYWKLIERRVVNDADGLLFTCEAELLLARETFRPYHPKLELNVGLGIEQPPAYTPSMKEAFYKACPELRDQPFVLFLSRIHEKKGTDLLIHAYAKIFGESFPKLVVAGPGLDTPYGRKVRELAAQHAGLNKNILFPGMLSGDAKWGAFYHCDAFVLPSHQENFGIAVVEALACSKPVLISDQVNIWREIKLAGGGFVSADTLEGTENLLAQWTSLTQEEKVAMGLQGRQLYERSFSVAPAAKNLLNAVKN